jgi:DNA-directed RNA polymerase subunit RPC12/RpoP
MLQGICPRCGTKFYGWALKNPEHQDCSKCGSWLNITEGAPEHQAIQPAINNIYTHDNIRHILKETDIDRWLDS